MSAFDPKRTFAKAMKPDIQPIDPLSQVVFVHDYLQLVFQDCGFTLYNQVTYSKGDAVLYQNRPGFCDAVVSLIGQRARAEAGCTDLLLHFASGAVVSISTSAEAGYGPEAWQFSRSDGLCAVEQNG
ncbi:hypothetical protein [Lysobacter sp. FW306-1B-D06B]|uniref:hypothetical protein n=1 Tax=Lysobacter sp. FW306-1B-D06B TaxID=3140250 RepID=UPI0031402FCC